MDFAILALGDLLETWVWGWVGLILNVVFWVGLLIGLSLLAVRAMKRARVPTATVPYAAGQPTAKAILQAQYARGEISRAEYEQMHQDLEG